jgi:hypothetical protein
MKTKIETIWLASIAFAKLFNAEYDDVKLSYSLSKMAKKINAEIKEINEVRKKLLDKYAVKEGKRVKVEGNNIVLKNPEAFEKDWLELMDTETEIDVWEIPFEAVEQAKLTPNEISRVEDFLGKERADIVPNEDLKIDPDVPF